METEREALVAEQEALHGTAESDLSEDEWQRDTEIDERIEAINEEIGAIENTHVSFTPNVMAAVGAVVIFYRSRLRIERGAARAADRWRTAPATPQS